MGGRGSTRLAMKYPHLFCSLHNQAGNVLNLASMGGQHAGDGRGIAPGWDGTLWKCAFGQFSGYCSVYKHFDCYNMHKLNMPCTSMWVEQFQRVSWWFFGSGQVAI